MFSTATVPENGELRIRSWMIADIVIHLVVRGHGAGLFARHPHQLGIDADRAKAVVAAIAGDHRGCGGGVDRGVGL